MKRGGKRSHVGVRVSAMSNDGYFYPGTIRGIKPRPGARISGMMSTADVVYQVAMDAGGDVHEFTHGMIVAPGFTPVSNVHLKFNQPVYASLNGREVRAIVQRHRKETNEVLLKTSDESETDFKMKLDDVRLLDSRRSMTSGNEYLLKHHHHHHHHDDVEAKKRPVSTSIEVPSSSPKSQKVQEAEPPMDDVMAAMVLTSLSGSPLVRRERNPSGDSVLSTGTGPMSPASSLSSGYGNVSPSPSPSTTTGGHFTWDTVRNTPSPASSNSDMESSPCPLPPFSTAQGSIPKSLAMTISSPLFSSSVDEGIDISGGGIPFTLEDATPCSPNKKFKPSGKTSYKCTWQGCGKTLSTVQGIERHIRTIHLSKKDGEEYSDHEEEFYYTEIDTTVESVSDTLANMFTSSPPPVTTNFTFDQPRPSQPHHGPIPTATPTTVAVTAATLTERLVELSQSLPQHTLHRVRQRGRHISTPGAVDARCSSSAVDAPAPEPLSPPPITGSLPNEPITMTASPVSIPNSPQFSWCTVNSSTSFSFPSTTSVQTSQAPSGHRMRHKSAPHSSSGQAKIRSEGKKCRKVYGMENRDMWCTQCRWKKACVRFT